MKILLKGLFLANTLLVSIGCSRKEAQVTPPPPEVEVATVVQRDIRGGTRRRRHPRGFH